MDSQKNEGGAGQSTPWHPEKNWSISLENWDRVYARTYMDTGTWTRLAAANQERKINMYGTKAHFIVPWACGTGMQRYRSLRGEENQGLVEPMVSHAWTGAPVTEPISLQWNLF